MLLLSSANFFQNYHFQKNYFRNATGVSNGLDPDHDQCSVSTDLGPNCLQRLLQTKKVAASKERVNY